MKIAYPEGKGPSAQQWLAAGLGLGGLGLFLYLAFGTPPAEMTKGILSVIGLIAATMLFMAMRLLPGRQLSSPLPAWVSVIGVALVFVLNYYLSTVDIPLWVTFPILGIIIIYSLSHGKRRNP